MKKPKCVYFYQFFASCRVYVNFVDLNFFLIWVTFVCPFVFCYWKCYWVTHLNISVKWSQIFMKYSVYVKIGLLSWLFLFVGRHMHACIHSACKHACTPSMNENGKNMEISEKNSFFSKFEFNLFPCILWTNFFLTWKKIASSFTWYFYFFQILLKRASKLSLKLKKLNCPKYGDFRKKMFFFQNSIKTSSHTYFGPIFFHMKENCL